MLDFVSSIGDSIGIFVQFITGTISGIVSVFQLVGESFVYLNVIWAVLPPVLLVFCVAGITICIVFQLIGR